MYCGAKNKGNVGELCGKCYVAKKEVGRYERALMGNFNTCILFLDTLWNLGYRWTTELNFHYQYEYQLSCVKPSFRS